MTELERVQDVAPHDDTWLVATQEWVVGEQMKLKGRLRQAQAAYMVERRYGEASLEEFGKQREVMAKRSKVYAYANAWSRLLASFGHANAISERLDDSPLTMTNVLEAAKEENIPEALDEAEDEGLSSRQQKARRREKQEPKNVETVHMLGCPECGSAFRMKDAKQWEEAV